MSIRALLGSGFEVSGASGIRVRSFGRFWDPSGKRKKLVFERRPKPLHFCLTSFFTFAISGRISAESTCASFWDSGSKFWVLLGFGFESLVRVREFGRFWDQGSRFWALLGSRFEVLGA